MRPGCLAIGLTLLASLTLVACAREEISKPPRVYVTYPEKLDPACRDGSARIFDECGDQLGLLEQARARAKSENKVLLVEVGAEWCIWCHVFDAHINGEVDRFRYTYGSPDEPEARYTTTFEEGAWADAEAARQLRAFVAENFVVVHIDIENAPNGSAVLDATASRDHFPGGIPFVFTVDESGQFANRFKHDPAERRRDETLDWYRGYDRRNMLAQLAAMRESALPKQ
jgi:hypothetical protein